MALFDLRERLWIGPKSLPLWAALGAAALAYFAAAEAGLTLATQYHPISPIWPAAGVAVAMVRQFGVRLWPGILVGAFAANAFAIEPITALFMAAGSTLQAAVGGTILRRLIDRQSDTFILARTLGYVLAACFAPVLSASIGVGTLWLAGSLTETTVMDAWLTWWAGDALGVLVVASALLALRRRFEPGPRVLQAGGAVSLLAAVLVVLALVRVSDDAAPLVFLAFPLVFFASRALGPRGGTWTVLAFAVGLVIETVSGSGPFAGGTLNQNLLDMQVFIAVLAVAALILVDLHRLDLRMAGAVLLVGTGIAVVATLAEHHQALSLEELRFRQSTERAIQHIREKTASYSSAMRTAASLFAANKDVTRSSWRDFIASLTLTERYPGMVGIGVIVPVKPDRIDSFVAEQRATGAPDFTIKSVPGSAGPQPAGEEKYVVQFVEPAVTNSAGSGVDIGTESSRREGARAARDSGLPAISGPVTLASDQRQRLGFHFYFPVYDTPTPPSTLELRRAHFRNWVFGRFIIQDFFDSALMPLGNVIIAEVFDGDSVDAGNLLTSTWSTWGVHPNDSGRRATAMLPLGGHHFTIQWHIGPGFSLHDHRQMTVVGSVILLLTILLAALIANLQSLRQRATVIAERMTGQLAEAHERFELVLAGTRDGIWDWDLKAHKMWRSPGCRRTRQRHAPPSTTPREARSTTSTSFSAIGTRTGILFTCTTRLLPSATAIGS